MWKEDVSTQPKPNTQRVVLDALRAVNPDKSRAIALQTPLSELLPDSLTAIAFAHRVEKTLGSKIPFNSWMRRNAQQMEEMPVEALVHFVDGELGSGNAPSCSQI